MRISFTELYEQNCQDQFHISREQVRQTVTSPDAHQIMKLDELELGFFIKRITRPDGDFFVLVCAHRSGDDWLIELGFKLLPEIVTGLGTLEPLIVLQQFAQRFGLGVRIGHQFNRFIFREEIPLEQQATDPTALVQIVNPSNHSFIQSVLVRIDNQGGTPIARCAIAYAIDTDQYIAWLTGKKAVAEVIVEIAPQIRGHATPRDLIVSTGTITFISNYREIGNDKTGFLFKVRSQDYYLEVGFAGTHFYIARNQQRLEYPIVPVFRPTGGVFCAAIWEPVQLSLIMLDESYEEATAELPLCYPEAEKIAEVGRRKMTLQTPPTLPPNSLLAWARKEAITPATTYASAEEFYEAVTASLQAIEDKVATLDLHNPFWDITYAGSSVLARHPKRETDIHPTIHSLLFDIAIAKNFEIVPEYPIAGGRLDFLITGFLTNGQHASVCVEFKHAHSDDLVGGLVKQLPAYMHAKGCNYGLYCVMYFRGNYFTEPKDYDALQLAMLLHGHTMSSGLLNVRVIVLDFSHSKPPSKL